MCDRSYFLSPPPLLAGTEFGPFALPTTPNATYAAVFVQYCANFTAADALAVQLTGAPLYTSSLPAAAYTAGVPPIFTASGCTVSAFSSAQPLITCSAAPGVGAHLDVRVTVAGLTSAVFPDALSYAPPTITAILGAGADLCPTEGNLVVTLIGSQFGPATPLDSSGNPISGTLQPLAWYGPNGTFRYAAASCYVRAANTQIDCLTAPGTGKGHLWTVIVGNQSSPVMLSRPTSYHPPIVSIETGEGAVDAQTYGGQVVVIQGAQWQGV